MKPEVRGQPVMTRLEARIAACGNRLKGLAVKNWAKPDGSVNWRVAGCCDPLFNAEGELCKIKHVSGDEVDVNPDETAVSK
eukprot:9501525-Pyramimonas_sp.AAC.1